MTGRGVSASSGLKVERSGVQAQRTAAALPSRGMRIDRFVIAGSLPPGRHATILQARDKDGSFVALKLATTKEGAWRVEREAQQLQALGSNTHPAARFVGSGAADGRRYLAASWMPGAEARVVATEILDQGRPSDMLELCTGISRAYAALHARGILHGQVHPRHVLADGDASIRLLDFSLAASPLDAPPATRLARYFHSLSAPEQAAAILHARDPPLTAASEQYSVAALLYLLVTRRMYARLRLERRSLARDIINSAPTPLSDHGLRAWPELEAVLRRALQHNPRRRHASMHAFAQALAAVDSGPGAWTSNVAAPPRWLLSRALEAFRREVDSAGAMNGLVPPTCSVNSGGAGVALALTRLATVTEDAAALESAERWLARTEYRLGEAGAFDDGDKLRSKVVGPVSPLHTASGVAAVRAFLSHATRDHARHQAALDDFRAATQAPCENLDLTLGRSSVLLCAALLYAGADSSWPATQRLARHGDEVCHGIWRDLPERPMTYFGIAHGWAGVAYATMMWARARGVQPLPQVRAVLEMLARAAEPLERGARWPLTPPDGHAGDTFWPGWCHGNAGYVFLWNLARAAYGEAVFAQLAERSAWLLDYRLGVGNLCCGRAGQAYAALNHYRSTGEERWRSLAGRIANRRSTGDAQAHEGRNPLSLYKGQVGLALLAIELERPDRAAMPLFEFDAASGGEQGGVRSARQTPPNVGRVVDKVRVGGTGARQAGNL